MTNIFSRGLPHGNGASGGGPGSPRQNGDDAGRSEGDRDLTLSIRGVRADAGEEPGEIRVEITTTRGVITVYLLPCEGRTGVAVFLGDVGGGSRGPAGEVFVRLGPELVRAGVTALRVEYRHPGGFEECVLDALAACSFIKGIGAERVVLVGHSFSGAVAVKAASLANLAKAVIAISPQRYGTFEVDELRKPLLLIHGSNDQVLDPQASRDIYERAREPKHLVILEGAGHGLQERQDDVFGLLRAFVVEYAADGRDNSPKA